MKSVPVSYKLPAPFQQIAEVTISYDYDPLYRLKEANYSTGDTYHYGYDAVGNRLTQDTQVGGLPTTTTYLYDDANRVQSVNGVTYTFDANGNLRNDGINTYTYDSANRLKTMNSGSVTASYAYSGMNDRLQETVNGNTTTFTMDYNTGLTQALSDGTNHYIYGVDRIAQVNAATEYFLGDALGSVRQLTDQSGEITYASAYDPYGVTTSTVGASQSAYGYTNEYASQGLVYLRSRMYNPAIGRFTTKDSWMGDESRPLSFNGWNYVGGNPINLTDPSGFDPKMICPPPYEAYRTCTIQDWYAYWGTSLLRMVGVKVPNYHINIGDTSVNPTGYAFQSSLNVVDASGQVIGPIADVGLSTVPGGGIAYDAYNTAVGINPFTQQCYSQNERIGMMIFTIFGGFGDIPGLRFAPDGVGGGGRGISQSQLHAIEQHLQQFGYDPANSAMIERLRRGFWTIWDQRFVEHELMESRLMKEGIDYDTAHKAVLELQGIEWKAGYEAFLYHPEVIDTFSEYFNEITRNLSKRLRGR